MEVLVLLNVLLFSLCVPESSFHKDRAYNNSTGSPSHSRPVHHEYGDRTAEGTFTFNIQIILCSDVMSKYPGYIMDLF